jgi:circadian clock protein KaiA
VYGSLSICLFSYRETISQTIKGLLVGERYRLHDFCDEIQFTDFIETHKEELDCLIVTNEPEVLTVLEHFSKEGIFLPVIILFGKKEPEHIVHWYHSAEIYLSQPQVAEIISHIEQAIAKYLTLAPSCPLPMMMTTQTEEEQNRHYFLMLQQRRLADKLKERLDYLGVYYRRNPKDFYRNLNENKKKEVFQELFWEYRNIILNYFSDDKSIETQVDEFANKAFFSDFSVSQILEIHMLLMDEFAQQLKLEGRSEEILLDYRLALIDTIAHLCEMYRRSIPREDLPFELLFRKD